MATTSHPHTHMSFNFTEAKTRLWAVPIGRLFLSLIFILSGINHFRIETIGYAAGQGIPMANILVPLSGIMALVGGLSILFGYHAKFGAMLLIFSSGNPGYAQFLDYFGSSDAPNADGPFYEKLINVRGSYSDCFLWCRS